MKCADSRAIAFVLDFLLWQKLVHALPHFARGLVRERHAENVPRHNPARDHVRNTERDDTRLARARAREDEHRTVDGLGGHALLRVERVQVDHRARSLICGGENASAQGKFLDKPRAKTKINPWIKSKRTAASLAA